MSDYRKVPIIRLKLFRIWSSCCFTDKNLLILAHSACFSAWSSSEFLVKICHNLLII